MVLKRLSLRFIAYAFFILHYILVGVICVLVIYLFKIGYLQASDLVNRISIFMFKLGTRCIYFEYQFQTMFALT